MKVTATITVLDDDGSEFASYAADYCNVPRPVYEYMEGETLAMLQRWNEASKQATGKGK